ncbi:precorrin-4 C11-methyltransferase [Halopolyspora algeriensis]|uniref:Precorrin-4 C11-methyltransferase n=1 Tax=Halopolyspora algeriensis TaxID=1500506 RepID=A0A368VHX2_9ACTN|nr:precorrin-4 C11-methyltransferase [Halopolyspora algeriensis]TQM56450.1 precorrin-4 C11-methyltransferase [Halopolyspora algeriensis]
MTPETRLGRVSFIGAGPGAADLITVRGARRIAEADIVVWAASLVTPECVQEHARSDVELVDSSRLTHEDAVEIYRRAERDRLNVARVHSGDPSLWGAVQEQHDVCARMALEVEIVPGVAAFSAAAASVGRELTVPEVAQSVVLTRLEGGKTPMPSGEKVREFAKHGTTMALFLSAARTGQLVEELRAGGYGEDVPVVVAYKTTWPDELMLRTTLGELESTVKQHKLWRHTLFLVGWALTEGGTRSHLYNPGHFHTFRRADPAARRALRAQRGESTRSARRDGQAGARENGSGTSGGSGRWGRSAGPGAADSGSQTAGPVQQHGEDARRPGQPDPDVAWWAVREWQQNARDTPRGGAARAGSRAPAVDAAQSDLLAESEQDGAEQRESVQAVVVEAEDVGTPASSGGAAAAPEEVAHSEPAGEETRPSEADSGASGAEEAVRADSAGGADESAEATGSEPATGSADRSGSTAALPTEGGDGAAQDGAEAAPKPRKTKSAGSATKSSAKGSGGGNGRKATGKQASGKADRSRGPSQQG